ncbi:MAG: RES family NAD+ phosphorylase [Clostridia bacterium]
MVGRGTILNSDEVPNFERFLPKEEFIKENNRFSPPKVEWLYLAIGEEWSIHECAQSECRAKKGDRFGFCHFQFEPQYDDCKLVDLTIADDISYTELNLSLEEYRQEQVKKGIKIAKALGYVPEMRTDEKEFGELLTRWAVYTYAKLLSEQIFVPLDVSDNKAITYAPFQTMAQYYISLGYSGIVYGSTVCPEGKNIVLFDKHMACPEGAIEDYIIS